MSISWLSPDVVKVIMLSYNPDCTMSTSAIPPVCVCIRVCPLTSPFPSMSTNQLLVSPSTVIVKIALVPSIVAAITFESSDAADVMVAVVPAESEVSPMSRSMSF